MLARLNHLPNQVEKNSDELTPAILPAKGLQARDRLGRTRCPPEKPWLCDGVSCFNKYEDNCCKGGRLCHDPRLCVRDEYGRMGCK
ncbi:hypothetical protein VTO42DRAFT_8357 [Malbranchea cinnamomea]